MSHAVTFSHHRLDVYRLAVQLAVQVRRICDRMPRGSGPLADQMIRAAQSTALLIAEGANRAATGDKRQRFRAARGEVGECAAALEMAAAMGLVPVGESLAAQELAARISAMTHRLAQRFA